ncbi:hypothetical protein Cci01nite_35780 [Catellatospora citrea]|uniref:Uncharacterized protein n=1 Tax=Catellatospora citrea TaxID=53366 RepID=A0A8J3KNG5_9ACTN|nr:hypothetical protein C8E86_2946 [Catellatospora citrea]GIF98484.1 hypothetical protein Cci01nite_35780 [Catellatospora citrea]
MQPEQQRRDWTVPIVVGVVVLIVALVVCLGGAAAAYLLTRPDPAAPPSPSPSPSPVAVVPSPTPASPARCLIGQWRETSYTSSAELFGVTVQLTGAGTLLSYGADGTVVTVDKVTRTGTRNGDRYEVIHNGSTRLNYEADDEMISYSNASATGTTTWKVNGSVRDRENLSTTITPERYTCKGDKLRVYGDGYSIEADRILPPGRPV